MIKGWVQLINSSVWYGTHPHGKSKIVPLLVISFHREAYTVIVLWPTWSLDTFTAGHLNACLNLGPRSQGFDCKKKLWWQIYFQNQNTIRCFDYAKLILWSEVTECACLCKLPSLVENVLNEKLTWSFIIMWGLFGLNVRDLYIG